jgi:hypothetical protein
MEVSQVYRPCSCLAVRVVTIMDDERAAIREFDGELPRVEAEALAYIPHDGCPRPLDRVVKGFRRVAKQS